MEQDALKILQKIHVIPQQKEVLLAAQAQQNSPVKETLSTENNSKTQKLQNNTYTIVESVVKDTITKGNYIPSLCISKKEYESIVNKRPLIKFRPLRNSLIKSIDKTLLAESFGVSKAEVDKIIDETLQYMIYRNPVSMYYNPNQKLELSYTKDMFEKLMLERKIIDSHEINKQELLFYEEQSSVIIPYVYRHGTKNQLIETMKMQLSDAKSVLKQLYNILNNECYSLYSYFERPIHALDNRSIIKMEKIIGDGLSEAHKKGYLSEDMYTQNVQWALDKIYSIQSDTSLREAFRIVARNS